MKVYGLLAELVKMWDNQSLRIGLDGQYNDVTSTAERVNVSTGEITTQSTRYPDGGSTMLNAARERRRATQESVQENQQAQQGNRGLSPQEAAEANVRRSMQQASGRQGTNGVFQIISKSTRMASFSFRGWKASANNSWRQVIEVDAGLGGNVELAIVRRMIDLIRTHYSGDFSWESQRLGRVINLSARPQDSAELETFMMKEFFSNPGDR